MNLADYLSELLGQQDEVSVPGLGYFMRTRINAFYNDAEGRFYPPYHQVTFVPQPKDDDTFAKYVADKKNISLASSQYFVEKFITKLREEAAKGKYLFADLGSFQGEPDHLVFKPNDRIPADPEFYGYTPVEVFKVGQPLSVDSRQPVFEHVKNGTQPVQAGPAAVAVPPHAVQQPDYFDEDAEPKKRLSIWTIVIIALVVLAVGVFALFELKPAVFDSIVDEYHKLTDKKDTVQAVIRHEVKQAKKDTAKKMPVTADTSAKPAITPLKQDTVPKPASIRYEAVAEEASHEKVAEADVKRLKSLGFDAYILPYIPGTGLLKKISVGQYPTKEAADSVINALVKSRVIKFHHVPVEIKSNPQ